MFTSLSSDKDGYMTLTGFDLGSPELKASFVTTDPPPPRPMIFCWQRLESFP